MLKKTATENSLLYTNFVVDIQDETKEEHISELKELRDECDSLKALIEKRTAELTILNNELFFKTRKKKNVF
jgi:prephenate dehydrogenase